LRRVRWAGHVAKMGERRNRWLVEKPEGKRPLERWRRRWVDNIKINFVEIRWGGVVWLRIGTSGELLWIWWWIFGLHEMSRKYWVASRVVLSSIELVSGKRNWYAIHFYHVKLGESTVHLLYSMKVNFCISVTIQVFSLCQYTSSQLVSNELERFAKGKKLWHYSR
jgi:hypothetical protein